MKIIIRTPLGEISSFVEINGITYEAETSNENEWSTNNYRIICSVAKLENDFDSLHVDGRYKIIWKISSLNDIGAIKLTCRLDTNLTVDIDNDNDECKSARYFKYKGTHLCISSESDDGLLRRAETGKMMPKRLVFWFKLQNRHGGYFINSIAVTDDELGEEVYLPDFKKGETAEIKYAIAWKGGLGDEWNADVSLGSEAFDFTVSK